MNPRLKKLRTFLLEEKLDAILISSPQNIIYVTNFSDFTTVDRDGYVLITKKNQYIFTHGIYKEAVEKQVPNFTLVPIQRENPISAMVKAIIEKEKIKKIGFEAFDLRVTEYQRLQKEIDKKVLIPTVLVQKLRIQKTIEELRAIKKACKLGDKAFTFICKQVKLGVTEKELSVAFEFFVKSHGANLSFDSIIAFGPNVSRPHHVPSNTKLKKNQFVLFDCGIKLDNYCSDMTRTVFFGKATMKQKETYKAVLSSQQKAVAFLKERLKKNQPIICKKVDAISREYLVQKNYPSIPHSLGHGIGLEVHEAPRLTPNSEEKLENGNVFSIEPGVYLPGEFGIRIEDLFAIENSNLIQLTKASTFLIEL